jgi:hypothetical protein
MLEKLVAKRLIAVGDPWQSIYAFRGAVCNGMSALHERFSMTDLPLSVTFRVPKTGVERARSRVPHFVAALANPVGEVTTLAEWSAADVPAEAAIICRNNAPLISLAFKLLRSGRAIKLVGMDIGAGLVRTLRKLGPLDLHGVALTTAIYDWTERELRTARRSTGAIYDRQECLYALCHRQRRGFVPPRRSNSASLWPQIQGSRVARRVPPRSVAHSLKIRTRWRGAGTGAKREICDRDAVQGASRAG